MTTIIANDNINLYLNDLKMNGYKYIIKAQDKFLSGWGCAENKKHVQLIACRTETERDAIEQDLKHDATFNYVNWCSIYNTNTIYNFIRNKSYTIRNDWTRAFATQSLKEQYMNGR